MNAKHYVSLEVAKMLEEKGYDKERDFLAPVYTKDGVLYWSNHEDLSQMTPAPTLLEAMDWLEERGIIVMLMCERIVDMLGLTKWNYAVVHCGRIYYEKINENEPPSNENVKYYTDRNECMNAAIKKGVELL